jgi:hypothetical protein
MQNDVLELSEYTAKNSKPSKLERKNNNPDKDVDMTDDPNDSNSKTAHNTNDKGLIQPIRGKMEKKVKRDKVLKLESPSSIAEESPNNY